jgi:hypothetical protein
MIAPALKEHAKELKRLAKEKVPGWLALGTCFRGEALTRVQEGLVRTRGRGD